ncbi:MAG TPA: malto-oligosyltrehalose synthase [Candidatus Omnitrophota bacterium]|nr:malto-oligosyltrehalose synthase [Candidatus Omnitrophota bacterium]
MKPDVPAGPHIPVATYRLQFTPSFGFSAARARLAYLAGLGISDLYASPIFKARKGSPHGYDVVDPNSLNPELGTDADFAALSQERQRHGLFWIQDIVPNHMAYDPENRLLMDVFEKRGHSLYYNFFDVNWAHIYENLHGRILAPFLGRFYSEALEEGEIQLSYAQDGFKLRYYDHSFPLYYSSYKKVLMCDLGRLEDALGKGSEEMTKYCGVADLFSRPPEELDGYDRLAFAKNSLWELYAAVPAIKAFLDENIRMMNGCRGDVKSFQALDELLLEQCFRFSFWKVASEELNYRRFFTVNDLISVRVEKPDVFDATHAFILKLVKEGHVHGLRVDHIDGLYDPLGYVHRVRQKAGSAVYISVEKILSRGETLPADWPVAGTTGYDFLNAVNGVFCCRAEEKEFNKIYSRFTKPAGTYEELVVAKKRLIIGKHMAGDIDNLAYLMKKVASRDRYGRDITLYGLRRALVELMSYFPVYRTYIRRDVFSEQDKKMIGRAIKKAGWNAPGLWYEIYFIERFLMLDVIPQLSPEEQDDFWQFIMKFQQLTAPIMAKGFEDTMFYTYNRLIALNEVGGDPGLFGLSLNDFHDFNQKRQGMFPHAMNATATHDVKRGEDVRARIHVLSEIPEDWEEALARWRKWNRAKKHKQGGRLIPDANDEYFIYQTLLGAFPFAPLDMDFFKARMKAYVIKAVREAKVHTAWIKPDSEYEAACLDFVDRLLDDKGPDPFWPDFLEFQRRIAHYGVFNSLSQCLLKMTCPGIPDFYQGSELWDLWLVDPDNRRDVDFDRREAFLREIEQEAGVRGREAVSRDLLFESSTGKIKLWMIWTVLKERGRRRAVFEQGEYLPLSSAGHHADSVIAFARVLDGAWSVTVAPRFLTRVCGPDSMPLGEQAWQNTHVIMPAGSPRDFQNVLTGQHKDNPGKLFLRDIFNSLPVALLSGTL